MLLRSLLKRVDPGARVKRFGLLNEYLYNFLFSISLQAPAHSGIRLILILLLETNITKYIPLFYWTVLPMPSKIVDNTG